MFRLRLFQLQELGLILPTEKVQLVVSSRPDDEIVMKFVEACNDNALSWMGVSFIAYSPIYQCIRIFLDV